MKVSIITVVYNNVEHISNAIESVLSQDYAHIEYIIVDGGSVDGTVEIIEKYLDRISVFLSESDFGLYYALNKGIRLSTGDVVGFLNSDDFFAHRGVVSQIAKVFSVQMCDIVYGDINYVKKHQVDSVVRYWRAGSFSLSKLNNGWAPPHPSFYALRKLYVEFGGFNCTYRIAADYDCMLRLLKNQNHKVSKISDVFVNMRIGGVSNNLPLNVIKKFREDYIIMKKNNINVIRGLIFKKISKLSQFSRLYKTLFHSVLK